MTQHEPAANAGGHDFARAMVETTLAPRGKPFMAPTRRRLSACQEAHLAWQGMSDGVPCRSMSR